MVLSSAPRRTVAGLVVALAWLGAGGPAPVLAAQATTYFRGASAANTGAGTASTLNLAAPSNLAVGDLEVLEIDATGATAIATPTGWTSLGNGTSNIGYYRVAYKLAASGDLGSTYALALGATRQALARIVAFTGVDSSNPIEASAFGTGTSTTTNYPTITTTLANSRVIIGTATSLAGSLSTITPLAGAKDRVDDADTAATWMSDNESDYNKSGAAGTGTVTSTIAPSANWRTSNIAVQPAASGTLAFAVAPTVPTLGPLALNGQAQALTAMLPGFAVDDTTGSGSGWNVTVSGNTGGGASAVFKQYCPNATCGPDTGPGYVGGGQSLAAGSLTLNSTGASWVNNGGTGSAPSPQLRRRLHAGHDDADEDRHGRGERRPRRLGHPIARRVEPVTGRADDDPHAAEQRGLPRGPRVDAVERAVAVAPPGSRASVSSLRAP